MSDQDNKHSLESTITVQNKKTKLSTAGAKTPTSVIGISRSISSCQRCRSKKVRCDNQFPSCTRCAKLDLACVSLDAATGREVPRSYVVYLEDKVQAYMLKLKELGHDPYTVGLKTNIPCSSNDPPCNISLYEERFRDNHVVSKENLVAGYVVNHGTSMQKGVPSHLASGELSANISTAEKVFAMKRDIPTAISKNDVKKQTQVVSSVSVSVLGNTESENEPAVKKIKTEPSNILTTSSTKESFYTISSSSLHSHGSNMFGTPTTVGNHDSHGHSHRQSHGHVHGHDHVDMSGGKSDGTSNSYLGDSSGIPFAKLMFTALNFEPGSVGEFSTQAEDGKSHVSDEDINIKPPIVSDDVDPKILPTKKEALNLVKSYFLNMNTQYPVMHREFFIKKYFEPIYGDFPSFTGANNNEFTTTTTSDGPNGSDEIKKENSSSIENQSDLNIKTDGNSNKTTQKKLDLYSLANDYTDRNMNFKLLPEHKLVKDATYFEFLDKLKLNKSISSDDPDFIVPYYEIMSKIPPETEIPVIYHVPLFFMNMVLAIGAGSFFLINGTIKSIVYKKRAHCFINAMFASNDRLEALSGLLLLSIYSLMMPNVPGVWYVMGNTLRLCVDLGLHTEKLNKNYDPFTKDIRRRLFWSTYSIDRQMALYFGRPFGIPEESISTAFISVLDDALITTNEDGVEDYSNIKSSTSSYKNITLAFIQIRQLQSKMLQVLYSPQGVLPREFEDFETWRKLFDKELLDWYAKTVPKRNKKMNCNFNKIFFKMNLYHTRTMLYGISPKISVLNKMSFEILNETTNSMLEQYYKLYLAKAMNFTWIAVHNLFMCGMTFLYTKYRSGNTDNFNQFRERMLIVLKSLFGTCEAAPNCFRIFKILSIAVKKLVAEEQNANLNSTLKDNNTFEQTEIITTETKEKIQTIKHNQDFMGENMNVSYTTTNDEMRKFFNELGNVSPFSNSDSVDGDEKPLGDIVQNVDNPNMGITQKRPTTQPLVASQYYQPASSSPNNNLLPTLTNTRLNNHPHFDSRPEAHMHSFILAPQSATRNTPLQSDANGTMFSPPPPPPQIPFPPTNLATIPGHEVNNDRRTSRDQQRVYDMIYDMGSNSIWDRYLGNSDDYFENFHGSQYNK